MSDQPSITLADLPRLKKAYESAIVRKKEIFQYINEQGEVCKLVTTYAKYLIQYLQTFKEDFKR